MTLDFLSQLNDQQREAVLYNDGPSLIIAGAGSGKTRVLTYKIAYLLANGVEPWSILALTFTNKAANEMKQRIGSLVGEEKARYINMGTFHSIFARMLRYEAERIGYMPNFTIYDESDSRSLLKSIIKEMNLDDKTYKPAGVHSYISMAKNHIITPELYANDSSVLRRDYEMRMPELYKIYAEYCRRCRNANAMDFDDLLTYTFLLLDANEEVRRKYSERFRFILVDEYQDTNSVQQRIIEKLASGNSKICAVGDDAQSIYGFRGANIDNILDFQRVFGNVRLFKLEQNYRSTQRIVLAANTLIKHNTRQIRKDVFSQKAEGEKILVKQTYSDKEEAEVVCKDIRRMMRSDNTDYSSFAILYRTNSQSRTFEESFRKNNIPYKIYGGLSFYQRKEIKDVMAYLRLVANPYDEEAFKRIINYPARGIGNTTLAKIIAAAVRDGVSLWQAISDPHMHLQDVKGAALSKISGFRQLIQQYIDRRETEDVAELAKSLIKESGISNDIFTDSSPENLSRQENIQELIDSMYEFVATRREEDMAQNVYLSDYLQEVSLLSDIDGDKVEDGNFVTLMTIHSAKGLEFANVFIVGVEENIFPSPLSVNTKRELEEERRLLYVAITRAEKRCVITYAKNRFRYGRLEFNPPSRFINDIAGQYVDMEQSGGGGFMQQGCGMSWDNSRGTGSYDRSQGYGDRRTSWNSQNSRPVASQFMADVKQRIVSHHEEPSVDPFGEGFKRTFAQSGGNLRKLSKSICTPQPSASQQGKTPLNVNDMIEHERFGIGTVVRVEGTGENMKATVNFQNVGTKQLLLKFARFKVIRT